MSTLRECSRGCGFKSRPGPIGTHERSCWTPATLERLYEIGSVDATGVGCWEWQARYGGTFEWYPRIRQRGKLVKVMHLVCLLTHGPRPAPKYRPLHSCDNVLCVRPGHLRWGTQAQNVQDTYDHGRRPRRTATT